MQPPTGHIALVFTDMERSTALWEQFGDAFQPILNQHNEIIRSTAAKYEGYEVSTEGDAFFLVFRTPGKALQFASSVHDALQEISATHVRIRIGIHVGDPLIEIDKDGRADYFGPAVNRAARVASAGHGGQTLLSKDASHAVQNLISDSESLQFLGEHYFRGLDAPEGVFQHNRQGQNTDFDPLRGATQSDNNLPAQTTSFIGRSRELKMLRELILGDAAGPIESKPIDSLTKTPGSPDTGVIRREMKLRDRGVRLTNITGPGGVGKSRLALALGGNLAAFFRDGIWYVDLAEAETTDQFCDAVAAALKIQLRSTGNVVEQISRGLDGRKCLLILDNFEKLTEEAETLTRWLHAAGGLKIVVTSREVMHTEGESEFPLAPLQTPQLGNIDSDTRSFSLRVSSFAAVQLFLDRAVHARPGFALTPDNAEHIAAICDHLDGMPLAIELAAARIRMMAPKQLANRLQEGKEKLAQRGRKGTTRNTTLHSAIEWSFDLLDSWEKAVFLKLAVFEGPFSLETVEEVIQLDTAIGDADGEAPDIMDIVMNLRDKSLLVLRETSERVLFSMLGIIRRFSNQRWAMLPESEVDELMLSHAQFFVERANGLHSLCNSAMASNMKATESWGISDIVAASHWMAEHGDAGQACHIVGYAATIMSHIGRVRDLRELSTGVLETLIKRFGSEDAIADETDQLYRVILAIANSEHRSNNLERGIEMAEKCLSMVGDDHQEARATCLSTIGLSKAFQRKLQEARMALQEVVDIHRQNGDKLGEARALSNLIVSYGVDEGLEMVEVLRRCLMLYTDANHKLGEARASNNLGIAYQRLGELDRAESLFRRSLAVKRELGDVKGQCMSHANLGSILQSRLRFEDALIEFNEALLLSREMTDRNQVAGIQSGLATIYLGLGQAEEALRYTDKDLQVRREIKDRQGQVQALSIKSGALLMKGDPEGARIVCDEMDRISAENGSKSQQAMCVIRRAQLFSGKARQQFISEQNLDLESLGSVLGVVFSLKYLEQMAGGAVDAKLLDDAKNMYFPNENTLDIVYQAINGTYAGA